MGFMFGTALKVKHWVSKKETTTHIRNVKLMAKQEQAV
jgi:hypothetical protein